MARQGATARKTRFYPGLKEELYIADFEPNDHVLQDLGIDRLPGQVVVLARTPPSRALYHQFENPLFFAALRAAASLDSASFIVMLRHPEQREAIERLGLKRCLIPGRVVDARSLMMQADLVIGAGGTLTREAALLNVPTVSVFAGKTPEVDLWLERQGRLKRITSGEEALEVLSEAPRQIDLDAVRRRGSQLVEFFVSATLEAAAA